MIWSVRAPDIYGKLFGPRAYALKWAALFEHFLPQANAAFPDRKRSYGAINAG